MRFSLRLNETMYSRLKHSAVSKGVTTTRLIKDLLMDFPSIDGDLESTLVLHKNINLGKKKSVSLRLSPAEYSKLKSISFGFGLSNTTILKILISNLDSESKIQKDIYKKFYNFSLHINHKTTLKELMQSAADSIAKELDIISVAICVVKNYEIIPQVINSSWFTKKLLGMIPYDITDYRLSLVKHKENLLVQSVEEKTPKFTNDLYSTTIHGFSKSLTFAIEKLLRFKCALVYPIIYDEKVVGVSMFSKTKYDDFSKDFELINAFSEYMGTLISKQLEDETLQQ